MPDDYIRARRAVPDGWRRQKAAAALGWPSVRRTLLRAVPAVVAVLVAAGCGSDPPLTFSALAPPGGLSAKSAAQVVGVATAAADAEGSFHLVSFDVAGSQRFGSVYDVAEHSGKQTISGAAGQAKVVVVPGIAYQRADALFLEESEGFPADAATVLAGRWISFRPGQPGYENVAAGDTLASAMAEATPVAPLTIVGPSSVAGQAVVGVSGGLSVDQVQQGTTGSVTLYVAESSPHLPVEAVAHLTQGGHASTDTLKFSRWGEAVSVSPPAQSTPITDYVSP